MTRLNDGADLEVAEEEDFGISRDSSGELQPVKQRIPGTEKAIKCIPLVPSVREEYTDVLESDDADEERIAELWSSNIVAGIGSDATAEMIDNIPYGLVAGINQALKNSSGEQVFLAVREQVNEEIAGHIKMAQELDGDTVGKLMEQMDGSADSNDEQS